MTHGWEKMKFTIIINYLLVYFIFSGLSNQSHAYEQGTHQLLSELAVERSVLINTDFISSLDLSPYGSNAISYHGSSNNRKTIQELISQGAYDEDENINGSSVLFHFYDPQTLNESSRGLRVGDVQFQNSMEWALKDIPKYSYQDVQEYFYAGLVAPIEQYRNVAFGNLFTAIGHVIHHVQDMAQPQHTRNEAHCPAWVCEKIEQYYAGQNIDTASLFESFTADNSADVRDIIANDSSYPLAYSFDLAADFWQEEAAEGLSYMDSGMATFSSTRFVTRNRNFSVDAKGQIIAPQEFPMPTGQELSMTPNVGPCQIAGNQGAVNGICKHWSALITDIIRRPINKYIEKYVAESITNFSQINANTPRNFVLDIASFEEHWQVLLPRAVSFSAGFINHIFRGQIDLSQDPAIPSLWYIQNTGNSPMSGSFKFLYDAYGYRVSVQTYNRFIPRGSYAAINVAEIPAAANKVIVAFSGEIGAEAGVTGVVMPYLAPVQAIPCGGSISPAGGIEGLKQIVELGNNPGVVHLSFNAFNIPDSLTVSTIGSGEILYSTGGMVSNTIAGNFYFDADEQGSSSVLVKVVGGDTKTAWQLNLSCPG
jgi:hypothetical protein